MASHTEYLGETVTKGGYTKQQIASIDRTAIHWKKLPSRALITREEKSVPGFRASKHRLTLLLRVNAADDFKLKPILIYHFENPRTLQKYACSL